MKGQHESTYALLVRSEDKKRGVIETIVYALFGLSAVILLWQFVQEPVTVPAVGLQPPDSVAHDTAIQNNSVRS